MPCSKVTDGFQPNCVHYFGRVDGVSSVVAGPVGNVFDKRFRFFQIIENQVDDFEVLFFVAAADIVNFTRFCLS